ncbi:MAG TPA: ComEC/Rec2 family competence protein [Kiritimatiellia bacterium]|nr:ComEC/Rec2 family competence protein [Kiritimatiellia bacterium]
MHPSTGHSELTGSTGRLAIRRPLLGLLADVLAGILLASASGYPSGWWLLAAWILLALALLPPVARLRTVLLHGLVILIAAAHAAASMQPGSPSHLASRMRRPVEHLKIAGCVADDPVRVASYRPDRLVWRFPFETDAVLRERSWRTAQGRVWVRWETTNALADVRYGQRWVLEGPVHKETGGLAAPPALRLMVDDRGVKQLNGEGGWLLRRWCLAGRRECAERLGRGLDDAPAAAGLIRALMLGYRQELPDDARKAFARTGTMHIVAISGAHVGMVALLMLALVRGTGLSQPRWPLVMAPLLVVYALSTGMAPSAVRACMMAITLYAAYACWRQPDSLSALALAALLILSVDPSQLGRIGFQLSFSVVAGLIIAFPPVREALMRSVWPLPEHPPPWREHVAEPMRRFVLDLLGVAVVAWLVSTPLIAYYFNILSPIGLAANLVVVPLAFLILFAACLSLLLGFVHPTLSEAYNHAARVFSELLFKTVDGFDVVPGGSFLVPAPSGWMVIAFLALMPLFFRGRRVLRRASAVALLLLLGGAIWTQRANRPMSIAVRHLGPTAVAHAYVPGSGHWLFETGPAFTRRQLARFLDERGVNHLHTVVLLRPTLEGAGALPALIEERGVGEIWIPDGRARSRPVAELLADVEARGKPVVRRMRGMRGTIARSGVSWEILHPESGRSYPSAAAGGLVLRLAQGPHAVILSPAPDPALLRALADAAQDHGASAWLDLAPARERAAATMFESLGVRADVHARPMGPGEAFRTRDPPASTSIRREIVLPPLGQLRGDLRAGAVRWRLDPEEWPVWD